MGVGGASGGGRLAGSVSPVFLRLALGVTFVWAGLGKLVPAVSVDPLSAAILANVGAITPPGATRVPPPAQAGPQGEGAGVSDGTPDGPSVPAVEPVPEPAVPKRPLPEPQIDAPAEPASPEPALPAKPTANPSRKAPSTTGPAPAKPVRTARPVAGRGTPTDQQPADGDAIEPTGRPLDQDDQGQVDPRDEVERWAAAGVTRGKDKAAPPPGRPRPGEARAPDARTPDRRAARPEPARYPLHLPAGKFTPADFPGGAQVRRMHEMTLLLARASHPGPGPDGKPAMALWPRSLGTDPLVRVGPLLVALTELAAGLCVLMGFFTRTGATLLAGVMIGALWLTQIGPAIQTGGTVLGIVPARTWWDPKEYAVLLWQVGTLAGALALAFAGPGALSLDRAFAAKGKPEADEE
jgi:uncharacterized membrane protein YphA (DoxX/SURF4 family)